MRVRALVEVWSLRGERERRDGGSSAALVSLSTYMSASDLGAPTSP